MMDWQSIVLILFCCVASHHLGLIDAVEKFLHCRFRLIGCTKCFTFWCTLIYCIKCRESMLVSVATSFLFAWLAIWFELCMGITDTIYKKIYDKIYKDADDIKASADTSTCDSESSMS